jgi:pimeloyl-ACP methyl ester carboxylesterase
VIGGFDARARLGEVQAPTLVAVGDQDPLIPPAAAEATAAALPAGELVVIPGAGHLAFVERPDAVNRALLGFLAAGAAGPAPSTP